jgi:hypothetical protein
MYDIEFVYGFMAIFVNYFCVYIILELLENPNSTYYIYGSLIEICKDDVDLIWM